MVRSGIARRLTEDDAYDEDEDVDEDDDVPDRDEPDENAQGPIRS